MFDNTEKAHSAAELLGSRNIDIIVRFISTYALSNTVLPLTQRCNVPVLMLNMQPMPALDCKKIKTMKDRGKMTSIWMDHCQVCICPDLGAVFNLTGVNYHLVTGYLDEAASWSEIGEWLKAAEIKKTMANNRIRVGHYYNGMLDVSRHVLFAPKNKSCRRILGLV